MDLKTPRDIPENIEFWSEEIEYLLSEWGEVALCYQYLHSFSQRKYKKKYRNFQIPIIVLSTLTGVGNFAVDSYIPTDFQHGFTAVVGGFNIFCGILGTLLAFLKYAELYESHRISALAWSKLSRNIEIELSLKREKRKSCRDFLKVMRSEYDNLMESSPTIDQDVIRMFNKKFEGKYKEVRKPIIVNGLREIKPFKSPCPEVDDKEDPETGEKNPNMEYESEEELIPETPTPAPSPVPPQDSA